MVGERGFEPPAIWSRTNSRFTKLLSRLGVFCVLHLVSSRYSAANGPQLAPTVYGDRKSAQELPVGARTC